MTAWDVKGMELRKLGNQAMLNITRNAASALNGASWGSHTSAVGSISGVSGHWGNGTVSNPNLKISLFAAALQIQQDSAGMVGINDLVLVFSPDTATALSLSPEIQNMYPNNVWAYGALTGTLPGQGAPSGHWSLPPTLWGFRYAVEDAVVATEAKGGTATNAYAIPKGTAYLVTRRDNELVNPFFLKAEADGAFVSDEDREAVPVYSTLCRFTKEEFTTEQQSDKWNRIFQASVALDYGFTLTSTIAAFQFTSCFG
jgi:hypothetical protein